MGIQLILSVIGLILTSIALFISNTVDGTTGISSGKKTLPSANISEKQIKSSNDTRPTDLPPAQSSSHQVVRTISEAAKREAVTNVASHNTIQVDNATNSRPRWVDVEHIVKDVINSIMKHLLPTMLRITSKVHISSPCLSRLLKMVVSVRQLESWAIKMVDASGKPFSGLLEGTLTDFGSYEECLNIIVESENPNSEPLRGKYCILEITPNLPQETRQLDKRLHNTLIEDLAGMSSYLSFLHYTIGVCIPSTCTAEDLANISQAVADLKFRVSVPHCEQREDLKLTKEQITVLCLLGTLVVLVVLGTTTELWRKYRNSEATPPPNSKEKTLCVILMAFSTYANGKDLLNTKTGTESIGVLHGFRFFTMAWVVLAHTYLMTDFHIYKRLIDFRDAQKDITVLVIWNSLLQVDTFFFVRLTPPMMLVISLMFILPLLSSGPFWHRVVEREIEHCRTTWWANMFYFNNFIRKNATCIPPLWYVAADMQLYLLSPIFLITFRRCPRVGWSLSIIGIVVSWFVIALITIWKDFPPSNNFLSSDITKIIDMEFHIHWKPYVHMGPYFVGLTTGYVLLNHQNVKLSPVTVVVGWTITTISTLAVVFGAYSWMNGIRPNVVVGVLYAAVHRTVFALGLAWITFACSNGYGGPVNALLSWQPFIVLGRLTYMAYLVHSLVIFIVVGSTKERRLFSHFELVCSFIVYLVISTAISLLLHLVFESPFIKLEQCIFPQPRPLVPTHNNSTVNQEEGEMGQVASPVGIALCPQTNENSIITSKL
ncbi:nose resistant to fluoxetine protein 6-like isoform X2 [Tachypleus tridentatus]|uniref:nose resistant to fluoxetine protein 6-like isoform X2 n=1 Tax=Tachypleus tridentatus TaxID=6853 RepID=UPI003FD3E7A6